MVDRVPSIGRAEQDQAGDGDLPTYQDLAEHHGPNSRFGRWRTWIEKRAAERYADLTPQEYARRRQRGWTPDDLEVPSPSSDAFPESTSGGVPLIFNEPATPTPASGAAHAAHLSIQTSFDGASVPPDYTYDPPTPTPPAFMGTHLTPTHLQMYHFGSRFLPHSTSPINALLPVASERLLLIGHAEGLSVLDMFPHEWTEHGLTQKDPSDAQALPMWEGEGVYQISLLEMEGGGSDSTPSGVVLMLIGTDPASPKENEAPRALRMYNLASLISLAKWTISQKGARPVDMRRPSNWAPQQGPLKKHQKHKSHGSITRGLKNLVLESPQSERGPPVPEKDLPQFPRPESSVSAGSSYLRPTPDRNDSGNSDNSWDVVDELPLRWASDYVPLASPGSRLSHSSVLFYELKLDEVRRRGGALLAIATKANILLYEAPRGERAFRFVKDYYTPLTPRSVTFIEQTVVDGVYRSPSSVSTASMRTTASRQPLMGSHDRRGSDPPHSEMYGPQPSLFVVFEKKAGLIRLADSAVGEVDLHDDGTASSLGVRLASSTTSLSNLGRRSRASFDGGFGFGKDNKGGVWLPPQYVELPGSPLYRHGSANGMSTPAYCLTRGKQTHIVPCPLPVNLSAHPPYTILTWNSVPSHVAVRTCESMDATGRPAPFLQVIAFGEDGVEVRELTTAFLSAARGKGKGKATAEEVIRADADVGGDCGFLCPGGHWQRSTSQLSRTMSTASTASEMSFGSLTSDELVKKLEKERGIYGWVRKGYDDYRVFWVGGTGADDIPDE